MLGSVQVGLGGSELECAWISPLESPRVNNFNKILLVGKRSIFKNLGGGLDSEGSFSSISYPISIHSKVAKVLVSGRNRTRCTLSPLTVTCSGA